MYKIVIFKSTLTFVYKLLIYKYLKQYLNKVKWKIKKLNLVRNIIVKFI